MSGILLMSPIFMNWGSAVPGQTEAAAEPVPGGAFAHGPMDRRVGQIVRLHGVPSTTSIVEAGQTDLQPKGPLSDN